MKKLDHSKAVRVSITLILIILTCAILFWIGHLSEEPKSGNRYKVIGSLYLTGIYRNLNKRQLNREMAIASLSAVRISGPEVAYQRVVPIGTIITIIGPAPKRVPLPFYSKQYFVRLDPEDVTGDLDVVLELNRGVEGELDGLNQELFSRI